MTGIYYEELTFTEDDQCDPKSAPNSGFINGKSAVTPSRTALIATAFTAPVRFCKAAEYDRTPIFTNLIHFVSRQIWQFRFFVATFVPLKAPEVGSVYYFTLKNFYSKMAVKNSSGTPR